MLAGLGLIGLRFAVTKNQSVALLCAIILATSLSAHSREPQYDASQITVQLNNFYAGTTDRSQRIDVFSPPATTTPRPAILFVHGGGWSGGDKQLHHDDCRFFAQHGYVCFSAGYRLVTATGNRWPAQLDDVQLAVRWIREHAREYGVNPAKIGAMGPSAGGQLVAMLGMRDTRTTEGEGALLSSQSSRVGCVVDMSGPSDLRADTPSSGTQFFSTLIYVTALLGGPAATLPDLARDASPIVFVSRNAAPFLIVHGEADSLVPVEHGQRLHRALKDAGAESTIVIKVGENHAMTHVANEDIRERALGFFDQHLGGGT